MKISSRLLAFVTLGSLAVVVALPLFFVLLQAVFPRFAEGSFAQPFGAFVTTLGDMRVLHMAGNTIIMGIAVCALSLVLALPLAMLRGLVRLPGAELWDIVMLVPIMIPPYVGAFAWVLMLQSGGYVSQLTGSQFGTFIFSVPGIVVVMSLHLFPIIYFAASRAFLATSGRFAEAARVMGASHLYALVRVTLPLAAPAIVASLLLVFSLTIEEYGTPAALGAAANFEVLVTAIEERVNDYPVDIPGAAILSLLLVGLALAAYVSQQVLLSRGSYTTISGKGRQTALPDIGRWKAPAHALFALMSLAAVALPITAVILTASTRTLSGGMAADNFTTANFMRVFSNTGGGMSALGTSLTLALGAALCTGLLGSLIAYLISRGDGSGEKMRGRAAIDAFSSLPNVIPGMVVAVGLILAWNQRWWPVTPYNTVFILLLAYVCLLLPYPVRYVGAALRQIGMSLDNAARVAGAGSARVLRSILAPLVAPHLLVAMAVVFAIATRELVTSIMLAPPGIKTVAIFVFRQFEQGSPATGMAMAVIAILSSTLLLVGFQVLGKRLGADTA